MAEQSNNPVTKFVVLFIPETRGNMTLPALRSNIKRLFKMTNEQVEPLFVGKPVVIKSGVDEDTALTYKRSIEACGGSCWIEPEMQENEDTGLMTA